MLSLSDILQLVIDGFDQSPFAKHNLVGNGHQRVPYVILNLGNKLNSIHKKESKQLLAEVSFVTAEFTLNVFNKRLRIERLAVIDIAGSGHKVQNLAFVIDGQMQLKAEEPPI